MGADMGGGSGQLESEEWIPHESLFPAHFQILFENVMKVDTG